MSPLTHVHGPRSAALAGTLLVTLGLAACGGGGSASGGGSGEPTAPPAPTTTAQSVKVVDGPLRNATVCVDLNDNGLCDTGEPTARTDANGAATLDVPNAEVGRHAVIAVVGTDAVDADFGPVTAPFVLAAPAGRTAVVSPLTTLVSTQMQVAGLAATEAETLVRQQLGLSGSLFADYTSGADASAAAAKLVARVTVLSAQQQAAALASVVGTNDISGTPIRQADVDQAVQRALLGVLPALGAVASDPEVKAASNVDDALRSVARDTVTNLTGLTADTARGAIGADRLLAQAATMPPDAPAATGSFRGFRYDSPTAWTYRAMLANASDNTPDARGMVRYYDLHRASIGGTVLTWGFSNSFGRQGDLLWNGSAWAACTFGQRSEQTVRDAAGFARYDYCAGFERGTGIRALRDVSGMAMVDVVREMRAQPGSDSGVRYADWGPADLGLLGNATLPAGSKLSYHRSQALATAPAYDKGGIVGVTSEAVAQGGDARTGSPACAAITGSTPSSSYLAPASSLETMVQRARGTPCLFGSSTTPTGSSGPRNEWWGQSTVYLASVAGAATPPAGTGNYYTTTREVRVAFPGADQVTYYNCIVRTGGGGRNCDVAGTGRYTIETLADARVMRLIDPPASTAKLGWDTIYVERNGLVHYGYQNRPGPFQGVRLNLTAANAMLQQLGLPALEP
ncbi:MAG: hypothetical protein RJA99_4119 [Pseudomonadota bacterium]|jgi:hypothetical protein